MERFPVIDLLPDEIIKDENSKQKLIEKGFGYML